MSREQAQEFKQGFQQLTEAFKKDTAETTEAYVESVTTAADKLKTDAHAFAKDMVEKVNQYTVDIQALYQEVYESDD